MDMNLFYRRILDFNDSIKYRASQVIVQNSPGADKDVLLTVTNKLEAELSACFNDLIISLQTLEEKSRLKTVTTKKATRSTKKKTKA